MIGGLMSEGRTALKAYECLYIVHPAAQETELKSSQEKYGKIIAEHGGTLNKAEVLGKRQLAYRVNNQREGSYILLRFEGGNDTLSELEHNLHVDDRVFRHMVTYEIPEGVGYSDELMTLSEKKERPRRGRRRFRGDDGGGRYRRDDRRPESSDRRPSPAREAQPSPAVPAAEAGGASEASPAPAEAPAPATEGGTE